VHAKPAPVKDDDLQLLEQLASGYSRLLDQVGRRIIGQREILDGILTAILSRGHALLVGVPGLAKTMMISTMAEALDLVFSRIQFTPDLMPGDITGTEILEEDLTTGKRAFRFVQGPVFANVVLADEINRTPPKTQAALLQAMQEHEVTAAGTTYHLPEPFFVLATQNPIEQEGTYPLPEAQLDRFMLQLTVQYPSRDEEERIVEETTGDDEIDISHVLDGRDLLRLQHLVRRIPAPKPVIQAAVRLTRMTRPADATAPPLVKEYVDWGAGPRASQFLVLGAKARAAMDGRPVADLEDLQAVSLSTLRHRVLANFAAEAAGRSSEDICRELIADPGWMEFDRD
jgi:MoxR-like ATPase